MNRDDIIRMAKEAGIPIEVDWAGRPSTLVVKDGGTYLRGIDDLKRFAALVAAAEREACAKVCEEKQIYSMPISCPDGISGCLVDHYVPAKREKTGTECAAAIRARGEV